MSDTENNNTSDKLEDPRASSPLRINRKRPASADLDGELVQVRSTLGVKVRNTKMDLNICGTWRQITFEKLMMKL